MESENKQTWEAPELKVIDVADQTLAGPTGSSDAGIFS